MFSLFLWWLLAIGLIVSPFQQLPLGENPSSLTFIPPGEIQETPIPTTIDSIHSYYTSNERSLEWNRNWHKQMTASGFRCEINEEIYHFEDEPWPWKRTFSYVDCFQVPIYLKEYYLPSRDLRLKEPAIEDWWSKQYDPQRTWSLVVSGNFLYSLIYDSTHPEKQELSDFRNGKDFSFFFMLRYRDIPSYEKIEAFIRDWAKFAYPKEDPAQFTIKESKDLEGEKDFEVYTRYKRGKENTKNELKQLFHYSVWCSPEKKQCLIYVNNKLLPVLWSIRTDYFGEVSPFDKQ